MKSLIFKYGFAYLALFFITLSSSCAATYRLYKTSEAKFLPTDVGFDEIAQSEVVILGETHYEASVQEAEAWALDQLSQRDSSFQLAWEFLDYEKQSEIQSSFDLFVNDQLTGLQWISKWFPTSSANHEVYLPMYEVAKRYSQKVMGTNASRSMKKKLMDNGRGILLNDSEVWPFTNPVNDAPIGYFERFEEIMGGHADTQTLEKYYLAQFYTDAYMANAISLKLSEGPVMMVVGHFHSDYGHGLPHYLKELGVKELSNIRIVDASSLSANELEETLKEHQTYGALGDYILVID